VLVDLCALGGRVWSIFEANDGQHVTILQCGLLAVDWALAPDHARHKIGSLRITDVGHKVLLQQFGESRNAATPQTVRSLRGHHGGIEQANHTTASTKTAAALAWSQASRSGMGGELLSCHVVS